MNLPRFDSARVLTIGDAMLDRYWHGATSRISAEAPVPVVDVGVNYSSSKAAIGGFTKSLAKELASRNITVNSIAPGFISSDMTDALTDDQKSEILNQIPVQKFGDPKNIAELAVFLASEKGQYITGQTISVDGGLYMI